MANFVCEVLLTEAPLDPPQKLPIEVGAIVEFWGIVRRLENGRDIEGIEYEAHRQMAYHQLRQIADQAADKFRLELIIIHHRIGFIAVGEPSLFLRVASARRSEGFQASQWIVDELKEKVPIWKRPRFKVGDDKRPASMPPAMAGMAATTK
jgi:molybdopterin synthase catalytic subunit